MNMEALHNESVAEVQKSPESKNVVDVPVYYDTTYAAKQKEAQKATEQEHEESGAKADELLGAIESGVYEKKVFSYKEEASKYAQLNTKEMDTWKNNFTKNLSKSWEQCKDYVKNGLYDEAYNKLLAIVQKGSTVNFLYQSLEDVGDGFSTRKIYKDAWEEKYGVDASYDNFSNWRKTIKDKFDKNPPKEPLPVAYTMAFLLAPRLLDDFLKNGYF